MTPTTALVELRAPNGAIHTLPAPWKWDEWDGDEQDAWADREVPGARIVYRAKFRVSVRPREHAPLTRVEIKQGTLDL